jgi:hypothetical protein
MAEGVKPVSLHAETLSAFDAYIHTIHSVFGPAQAAGILLWSDAGPDRAKRIRKGEVLAELWSGKEPVKVPQGLIHDWICAAFVPGVTVAKTVSLVQNYDDHKTIYKPEVVDSKLLSRHDNDFKIYLRLLKKKILTVVLDTEHDVHYSAIDKTCWICRSQTTRISEVHDAGTPKETVLPPDTGFGFLWRLYSYWTFAERDGGTVLECRAVSLTRDIPAALRWIIQPMVRKLPRESLVNTLAATRRALR